MSLSTPSTNDRPTAQDRPTARVGGLPLRTVLRVDAYGTAAFGVLLLALGHWLSEPLGLPVTWSVPFGIAMLGGAAALALIAGYPSIPAGLSRTVLLGNALSCVAMLALAFGPLSSLTGWGTAFLVAGAVVVAVFAELEYVGHRREFAG